MLHNLLAVFLLLACVCFLLGAFGVPARVQLGWIGALLVTLVFLIRFL